MQLEINAATLKPVAEKLVARLNVLGVVTKSGEPLVVDLGYEAVAAMLGKRNQHVLRDALAKESKKLAASGGSKPSQCAHDRIGMAEAMAELEERWGYEHERYTREDWQAEVAAGNTRIGYWEWAVHSIEANGSERELLNAQPNRSTTVAPPNFEQLAVQQIETLVKLGYDLSCSDFKKPYWECGAFMSDDFATEAEAWRDAWRDAEEESIFNDPTTMLETMKELEERWNTEHSHYTREKFQRTAPEEDAKFGYWGWVAHRIEENGGEGEHCDGCGTTLGDDSYDGKCGNCYDANTVGNHCDECGEYEPECECEDHSAHGTVAGSAPIPLLQMSEVAQAAYEAFDFREAFGDQYNVQTRNGWESTTGQPEMTCTVFLEDYKNPDEPTRKLRFTVDVIDGKAVNPRVTA